MVGAMRVLRAGPGVTIQDAGRYSYLRYGVTPAGPMDWQAFRTAHLALGNDPAKAAALEVYVGGVEVACEEAAVWVAFCGGKFSWKHGARDYGPAAVLRLEPGETLIARPGRFGAFAYLAVEGGFLTPIELGSRATHTRSSMGGIEGRMLRAGDRLACGAIQTTSQESRYVDASIEAPWLARDLGPFRVILGPQDDYFSATAIAAFFNSAFLLTAAADRMAYRFSGPEIAHKKTYDIVSDGTALGAIQVAGDRQPLVLMADHQPTGGYPKLGHVARVDIARLAQMRPGEVCRFVEASADEARRALITRDDEIMQTARHLRPLTRVPSTEDLLRCNLVGGVTDGRPSDEL
ncbi:MAG: biotin-dependent carboxyltransferase family protein [Beijerinckiaceae bacterium]